ncbi:MAG TPA: winged helix DNA-binding protein [Solirubrobacteraceae bacterium]|nr:winged helix DNA-binding protein [Solirubrobacteraceae bacterium]
MDPLFELAIAIKAAQRELERRMNDAVRPLGLTAPQADALVVIGQAGPLSLKRLGDLLIAESGHPSRLVDRLVEAGLVERQAASDDRRRHELTLTAKGRRVEERVQEARAGILALARALIGDRDTADTLALLSDLLEHTPYAGLIARRKALEG